MSADRDRLVADLRERLLFYREIGLRELKRPPAPPPSESAPPPEAKTAHAPPPARVSRTLPVPPARRSAPPAGPPAAGPVVIEPAVPPDAPAQEEGLFSARFTLPAGADPAEALETLRTEELGECTRCKLHEGRRTIVFGSGNPKAELMFVGEGPGADEDAQGLPFVGRAGQKLTEMIEKGMGIPRSEVYIANIIKCRPPGNRGPEPDEIAACETFLLRQIDIIRPKVIVALGRFAAQTLLRTKIPISSLRGKFWKCRDTLLMPTFHPAFLLRQYTPENRRRVWEDLRKVQQALASRPLGTD